MWTPLVAIKAKWKQIRPNEDVTMLDVVAQSNTHIVLMSIAFEAGRQWQSEHPTAKVDFPDYGVMDNAG